MNHRHVKIAFPSATQNEINTKDAQDLLDNGDYLVSEGANMPTAPDGADLFIEKRSPYGSVKTSNAGGVSVSGLEMSQNRMRYGWSREEVDAKLKTIMTSIHKTCLEAAERFGLLYHH